MLLLLLMSNIDDGVLVFFPSYKLMEQCVERWKDEGIFERIKLYDSSLLNNITPDSYFKEWNGAYESKNFI